MAESKFFEGIGRRKTSNARVRLVKGSIGSQVNGKPVEEVFRSKTELDLVNAPLKEAGLDGYYFTAKVNGGGVSGQVGAISLGLARAIYKMDETLKPALRKAGLVTRDSRMVERKKYNFVKARKKSQFSKR